MKRIYRISVAAAVLSSFIWLTGCAAVQNTETKASDTGMPETSGDEVQSSTATETPLPVTELSKGLTVIYTENDGLYQVSSMEGGDPAPQRIVDGAGISAPGFAEDGSSAAYIRDGNLYGYSFEPGKEELLLKNVITFIPDIESGYIASSKEEGVVHADIGQKPIMIWKAGAVSGGWVQCERLSLSPDGKLLAFTQRKYVDQREDPDTSPFDQNMGIWLYDRSGKTAVPSMIDQGEAPFFEWLDKSEGVVYPDSWLAGGRRILPSFLFGGMCGPDPCGPTAFRLPSMM